MEFLYEATGKFILYIQIMNILLLHLELQGLEIQAYTWEYLRFVELYYRNLQIELPAKRSMFSHPWNSISPYTTFILKVLSWDCPSLHLREKAFLHTTHLLMGIGILGSLLLQRSFPGLTPFEAIFFLGESFSFSRLKVWQKWHFSSDRLRWSMRF